MYYINSKVELIKSSSIAGTGWLPPMPDLRDYTDERAEVKPLLKSLTFPKAVKRKSLPDHVDLRQWCSDVEDQGGLGSCTAHACIGVVEYFERRAFGRHIEGSRLFIYKTTRNLMKVKGDTGAWLRNTMGALVLCGVPDERYWPYDEPAYDNEPPSFVYAVADNYKAVKYFCHNPIGGVGDSLVMLESVKKYLASGVPSVFGFYGFPSFESSDVKGGVPLPCPDENTQWGHAVAAVGYDDNLKIKNTKCNKTTVGALLFRN
jgi:C1A family cysteine protease